jgi:hypothetical protein
VGSIAATVPDPALPGAALPVAIAGQGKLPGTNLSVVLCEFGEGFKGLWIPYQHRSIRQAVGLARWWRRWSEWPSVKGT